MGSALSPILADICTRCLKTPLFEKISSHFWSRYVEDTFTFIDISLHKVDQVLQTMNSIDNNIKFTYEFENNGVLPFFDTLVSRTDKSFSTSVYRKNFTEKEGHILHLC